MQIIAGILSYMLLSNIGFANTAQEAWNNLVSSTKIKKPEFMFVKNNPDLPNVLIYGDSISISYTKQVRKNLKCKANVYRLFCNGGPSASFIPKMTFMHKTMCDKKIEEYWDFEWDVIHFNVGLHDLKYVYKNRLDKKKGKQVCSIDEYEKNLKNIISYLKKLAPNAKLIFATTTPVPEGEKGRFAGDALKYNNAALKVLKNYPEIIFNDLYSFTKPNHSKWWAASGNVHFGLKGCKAQGDEVTRIILNEINRKK